MGKAHGLLVLRLHLCYMSENITCTECAGCHTLWQLELHIRLASLWCQTRRRSNTEMVLTAWKHNSRPALQDWRIQLKHRQCFPILSCYQRTLFLSPSVLHYQECYCWGKKGGKSVSEWWAHSWQCCHWVHQSGYEILLKDTSLIPGVSTCKRDPNDVIHTFPYFSVQG